MGADLVRRGGTGDVRCACGGRRPPPPDIAMRWDFSLFGKFAVAHKVRFGESPRDTLGRRR